ncbi:MAG: iron complex outermembrane receptor protein [Sulfurimonas sp.]|jgi:iron complex outermembrane receptor protein
MNKKLLYISLVVASLLVAEDVFTLGEISIVDKENKTLDATKITNDELQDSPEKDVAKVLDTTAGITIEHKGGRNESSIIMRGFDAKRVGVYMDGIPVFVPYDGNFDYSRVLTTDLSSIDVAKGFSSSLNGPNAMAGTVNFVSKKPTKEFEGSISTQMNTDNDLDSSMQTNTLSLGGKSEKIYYQVNGTMQDRSHYNVSDSNELDGAEMDKSDSKSQTVDLKVGFTPDSNTEYVLGYNSLDSTKSQPVSVDSSLSKYKYQDWTNWDMDTIYFMANKTFSDSAVKVKVYRATYENTYDDYDDATYTTIDDTYDTNAYSLGANIQYSNFGLIDDHVLKLGLNYKKDNHTIDQIDPDDYSEYEDVVYSVSLEDIYQTTDKLKIISGMSYDYTKPNYATTEGTEQETNSNSAFNAQLGFYYDTVENQTTRFTVARKSHLPTMKERYSYKKNKAISNPDLTPEIATNVELGHNAKISKSILIDAAIFYSYVEDPIVNVSNVEYISSKWYSQEQNTGTERNKGFELTLKYKTVQLDTGLNYTYTDVEKDDDEVVTDIPEHQAYIFAYYSPISKVKVGGNFSYKKDLKSEDESGNTYAHDVVLTNISAKYTYSKALDFQIGVENLLDEDYYYDLGYPEAGREYYAKATYNF